MYAPASTARHVLQTDRALSPYAANLGQAPLTLVPRAGPPAPDEPTKPAEESNTALYVGLGLGVLCVGGLVVYLATRKKGRRR